MNREIRASVSCCRNEGSLGGLAAPDFEALDQLAVKLICLDRDFAAPLHQMGRVIGTRIALEGGERPISSDDALSDLISACGLGGVIESRFLHRDAEGARVQITGCAEVLGWQIPNVQRAVCGFDAGLFEGFLSGVTCEKAWRVEETACLGLGSACCEFVIRREQASGECEGVSDDDC